MSAGGVETPQVYVPRPGTSTRESWPRVGQELLGTPGVQHRVEASSARMAVTAGRGCSAALTPISSKAVVQSVRAAMLGIGYSRAAMAA